MTEARFDVPLKALDPCFEGGVPATLSTCDGDGIPNIGFLSVVRRVDDEHVALSFQFFRKTRKNLEENARARLLIIEPSTAIEYLLTLEFLRTETRGDTFEALAASLAAIASQTGMQDEFALRGADIYRVKACERHRNGVTAQLPTPTLDRMTGLVGCTTAIAACGSLEELLQRALSELDDCLGYRFSFLLAVDEAEQTLFSVASHGYERSGIGAEVRIGDGLIGKAAERRTTMRVANMSRERILADMVHSQGAHPTDPRRSIALPGLSKTESQLVVPLLAQGQLLGVLCLQSEQPAAFGRVDEEMVRVVADHIAGQMARVEGMPPAEEAVDHERPEPVADDGLACVRRYAEDDSIFIDNEYLIRGVAGQVLWLLLTAHEVEGRSEFTNRELRLDPRLGLPPIKDNLETRLIMLRKRLAENCAFIRTVRTGRGRFELQVDRALRLEEV